MVMYRVGQDLSVHGIENASTDNIRRVHQFVNPGLRRITTGWDGIAVRPALRDLAQETWDQLEALAAPDADTEVVQKRLDDLRAAYADLYEGAELLAMSSVIAARRSSPPQPAAPPAAKPGRLDRVTWLVPHGLRAKIPTSVRARGRAALSRLRGGVR
jgi:hypothetical protein